MLLTFVIQLLERVVSHVFSKPLDFIHLFQLESELVVRWTVSIDQYLLNKFADFSVRFLILDIYLQHIVEVVQGVVLVIGLFINSMS